jgi:ubiquinone biosynthesis protein UbiJ
MSESFESASGHTSPGRRDTLQTMVQQLLATQPDIAASLTGFAEELVEIEISPFKVGLLIRLGNPPVFWSRTAAGSNMSPAADGAEHVQVDEMRPNRTRPDLLISGTPGAFLARLTYGDASGLKVTGDVALAGKLLKALGNARVDWHKLLSPYLGDEMVSVGSRLLAATSGWLRQSREGFLNDAEEYIRHEAQMVPTKAANDEWLNATENLRQSIDRLEARIARLESLLLSRNNDSVATRNTNGNTTDSEH